MRPLSSREKRTIRITATLLALYLALFYGLRGLGHLEAKRRRSHDLRRALAEVRDSIALEHEKRVAVAHLERSLSLDVEGLAKETVVPEALAAIQKTAERHGVVLESSKEAQETSSESKELARFELNGRGTVDALSRFIHGLAFLGYPLFTDSLSLRQEDREPGSVSFSMSIALLDSRGFPANEEGGAP